MSGESKRESGISRSGSGVPKVIWWLVGGVLLIFGLAFVALLIGLFYIGAVGPDTSVYTGNRVPARFVKIAEEVGAIDSGETILFFYSDGLTDIRDGFYLVSDQKIATYSSSLDPPLDIIAFEEIETGELHRDESFFNDSEIYLELKDLRYFSIPVSSDMDGDKKFFEAIINRADIQAERD